MFRSRTPESAGLPSAAILAFLDRLEREDHDPHSVTILRHGNLLAEGWWAPYERDRVHQLYSLSKSFTSTAVGFAVEEGRLSVEDRVLDFFPDLAPENPSSNLRAMRVKDLLTMTAGHDADDRSDMNAEPGGVWMRAFLRRPVPFEPGTHFLYNSSATYALSSILRRLTGESLMAYLRPRLLDPLELGPARWDTDPNGIEVGGWGLYITTGAIARFGQFLLQKGMWDGRRLISEAWIDEATTGWTDNSSNVNPDWRQGYGYQFWRSRHGFRGDGAFGQFCVVIPEREMVVAITSASEDLQGVLDAIWEEILAPLTDVRLRENYETYEELQTRLANLALPFPPGDNFGYDGAIRLKVGEREFTLGTHSWIESEYGLLPVIPGPMTGRAARQEDDTWLARIQSIESAESILARFKFERPVKEGMEYVARGTWGPKKGRISC